MMTFRYGVPQLLGVFTISDYVFVVIQNLFSNAALPYTEYPLRMLKFEIRAEITEYDANGRGGAYTKRCLCESVKNACGSLQMS